MRDRISFEAMLCLEADARLILTDSGGMQKEAYRLRVPCVTLWEETEWMETVTAGWNVLVGSNSDRIVTAAYEARRKDMERPSLYGDGRASEKIVRFLVDVVAPE